MQTYVSSMNCGMKVHYKYCVPTNCIYIEVCENIKNYPGLQILPKGLIPKKNWNF